MAEQREVAERIQVYERLSSVSDERLLVHFGKFAVALRDRKKKVSLAELLCKFHVCETQRILSSAVSHLPTYHREVLPSGHCLRRSHGRAFPRT